MTVLGASAADISHESCDLTTMLKTAVIIPCLNEARSLGAVIDGLRATIPHAELYVYDNGSSDDSVQIARMKHVQLRHVPRRGKGYVIRQAFADVEADVYVMVDGDNTYDPGTAPELIRQIVEEDCDMATASRLRAETSARARLGHVFGNYFFSRLVQILFRSTTQDVLSGYRAFSRRFVKSFPATAKGFDIEVQITAQAAMLRVKEASVDSMYRERTDDGSKLRTIRDGVRIMVSVFRTYRSYAPSRFFGTFSALSLLIALILLLGRSDASDRMYAISAFSVVSFLFFVVGIILNGITRIQYQQSRLGFLQHSGVTQERGRIR